MEFRKLRANEIRIRVAKVTDKSVMLLAYKDARCDQNILDETVGAMNWQRHHSRDNANCTVSIWDEEKKMWIEKEDTGKESFSEKEKGLASDSFKRACYNWGIGRELYNAPNMWFPKGQTAADGNKCYDNFCVTDIQYSDNGISSITVLDTKTNKGKTFKGEEMFLEDLVNLTEDIEHTNEIANLKISEIKARTIRERCETANINIPVYLDSYNVADFTELTEEQFLRMDVALKKAGF